MRRSRNMVLLKRCINLLLLISLFFLALLFFLFTNVEEVFFYSSYHNVNSVDEHHTKEECRNIREIAGVLLNGSYLISFDKMWKVKDVHQHYRRNFQKKLMDLPLLNYEKKHFTTELFEKLVSLYNNSRSVDIFAKKHFITFADNCCEQSKLKAATRAIYPGGFDVVEIHDMSSLSKGFRIRYRQTLKQRRGSGYWLWKPYIILKTLNKMNNGDILMYQDSGAYLIQDAGPLLKLALDSKHGILLFYVTLLEQHYTKRDAFIIMDMDFRQVYKTYQRMASFILFRRSCHSIQFVMEWLMYATNPLLITDQPNTLGKANLPGYEEHRHDQSILSLLSKKWGIPAYRTPSQYGNNLGYAGGPFPQLIVHDRNRN